MIEAEHFEECWSVTDRPTLRAIILMSLPAIVGTGCDPAWDYRVSRQPSMIPATASTPVRLELVHAGVFSLGLDVQVSVINATTATIELESLIMTLRDARDSTLNPARLVGCSPVGAGPLRLAPSENCPMEAEFRVDPGTWRANPRLRTLSVRIEAKIDGTQVLVSLPLERTFH